MANIKNYEDAPKLHDGEVTNWISQINAGGTVYDIATHHGITFREGNGGATTTWNGLTDLEVIIPTIADIVQSPIEFAGTVGADGEVSWNSTHTDGPKTGYLVFVTADCEFAGKACEAGDMAIYNDGVWNVVSGENQVTITGTTDENIDDANRTVVAVGAAKDVLVVEGKALALTLDYADLNKNHLNVTKGESVEVVFGDVTVADAYLKLSHEEGETKTIGANVDLDKATALADGTVTLTNADVLVSDVNFGNFNAGELPTFTPNSEKTFAVTGGALTTTAGSDFVTNVTFGKVTFKNADANDENKITMLTSISSKPGAEFLNGIHFTTDDETPDFTIAGCVAPTKGKDVTFVEGLTNGATKVVTEITAGGFKLNDNTSDIVTGFGEESTVGGDVLSSVTVSANNDTSVLNAATVTDHVLSFDTINVTSSVSADYKYKTLTKTGFTYTAPVATDSTFERSGFTQAADVKYTFGKASETLYTPETAMWKLDTPELNVTSGAYTIDHTNMKATVGEGTFIASATQGTLPTWTDMGTTKVSVTGTVATDLSYEKVTVHTLAEGVETIALPGTYTLVNGTKDDNDVTVGAAGNIVPGTATVDLASYVKDVTIA